MQDPKELAEEGIALARGCITAAKHDDQDMLYTQVQGYIDRPSVIQYAFLYLAMLAGGIMNELMDDQEWSDFLLKENNGTKG